jgi:hypothetical protein
VQRAIAYLDRVPPAVEGNGGDKATFVAACRVVRGFDLSESEALDALASWNARCIPPWTANELLHKVRSALKQPGPVGYLLKSDESQSGAPRTNIESARIAVLRATESAARPRPLGKEAFHGVVGEFVRICEPHTEADPAAVLVQLLVELGSAIGRGPHVFAGRSRHGVNLMVVVAGTSAIGRKGTAEGEVMYLMQQVDPAWAAKCTAGGMSTGEGIINHVRDATLKFDPKSQSQSVVDDGVQDKRLCVIETEFGSVLTVLQREGNTLSAVLRQAWDGRVLRTLTKNSAQQASNTHVSVIGHITRDELLRKLDETDCVNGFANRFLWWFAQRSKILPFPGKPDEAAFSAIVHKVRLAVESARRIEEVGWSEDATSVWCSVYEALTPETPGLLGAVVARAAPMVLRLALLYAILDGSNLIKGGHLAASLAVWKYARESAAWVFGARLGDPVADRILQALRETPVGLTRTAIRDLFGRHEAGIDRALLRLLNLGLARCMKEATDGRSAERWIAIDQTAATEAPKATEVAVGEPPQATLVASVASVAPDGETKTAVLSHFEARPEEIAVRVLAATLGIAYDLVEGAVAQLAQLGKLTTWMEGSDWIATRPGPATASPPNSSPPVS